MPTATAYTSVITDSVIPTTAMAPGPSRDTDTHHRVRHDIVDKSGTVTLRIVEVADFTEDILRLVESPPHGFGSCLNPCVDCHARMLARAGELMRAGGFDFVSTGEVLGQRPMSQHRAALNLVAKDSGIREHLLRPLSALRLEPTPMELDGRVDRTRLLGLEGAAASRRWHWRASTS